MSSREEKKRLSLFWFSVLSACYLNEWKYNDTRRKEATVFAAAALAAAAVAVGQGGEKKKEREALSKKLFFLFLVSPSVFPNTAKKERKRLQGKIIVYKCTRFLFSKASERDEGGGNRKLSKSKIRK